MKGLRLPAAHAAILAAIFAAAALPGAAEPELSGSIEASLAGTAGAGGAADFAYGFEEYSNIRLNAKIGESGAVYVAANLIAVSGKSAAMADLVQRAKTGGLAATSFVAGKGYAAALELERLYFSLSGEYASLEAGLMRLAFGYGQVWSPSDFLSPKNPLIPEARPRGVLGAAAAAYPAETIKLRAFAVSGVDPLSSDGDGTVFGSSADIHGAKASLQALYAFEAPSAPAGKGIHRAGLSLKVEAGAGIAVDALYACEGGSWTGLEGLSASAGLDYSFLGGDLFALCQYLYNGPGFLAPGDELSALYAEANWYDRAPAMRIPAAAAVGKLSTLNRRNYLCASLRYRLDDYTSSTLSCVASLDDLSFSPALALEHEPFQGLGLSLSCRLPLDARAFSEAGDYGELGPTNTGTRASATMKAKLKF